MKPLTEYEAQYSELAATASKLQEIIKDDPNLKNVFKNMGNTTR